MHRDPRPAPRNGYSPDGVAVNSRFYASLAFRAYVTRELNRQRSLEGLLLAEQVIWFENKVPSGQRLRRLPDTRATFMTRFVDDYFTGK